MSLAVRTLPRLATGLLLFGCSSRGGTPAPASEPPQVATRVDAFDVPITGITRAWEADFNDGDLLFSTPLREADGLGPLYTRAACASCHEQGARGPGLVQKMSVVEADGVTPAADQIRARRSGTPCTRSSPAAAKTPILAAEGRPARQGHDARRPAGARARLHGGDPRQRDRARRSRAGRTRTDGIHGRINRVTYASEAEPRRALSRLPEGRPR